MQMDIIQFQKFAQVVAGIDKQARKKPKIDPFRGAYPDYGRSLVSQNHQDPTLAGIGRGAKSGLVGGVLAAVIARLLSDNPAHVGAAALGGAALGGVPGFISGKREAQSEHTKNLALRRLGINNPAELLVMRQNPGLAHQLIEKGTYL